MLPPRTPDSLQRLAAQFRLFFSGHGRGPDPGNSETASNLLSQGPLP
jgi:hypothetical protein